MYDIADRHSSSQGHDDKYEVEGRGGGERGGESESEGGK